MSAEKTKTSKFQTIYFDIETSVDCWVSPTFTANIYVGLKPGYDGAEYYLSNNKAQQICQEYCNEVGLAVTFEDTKFIYTNGNESGIKVGLINYPRYPSSKDEITKKALRLASILKEEFKQFRVSVVTPDVTYMIGDND
jgi:hypothetical protein